MGRLAGVWGLLGVIVLFLVPIVRLGGRGLETLASGLTPFQWTMLVLSVVLFGLGEGVMALQRHWVPRVVERARTLQPQVRRMYRVLAPMYVMELVGAPPRGLVRGWGMVIAIAILAISVQYLPDPWRGIIDLGVSVALAWALLFLVRGALRIARGPVVEPERPPSPTPRSPG